MSVVLRCPSCGTSRETPGECEACHEAQVSYFCTNHTPGLWLLAPACPACGATFGDAPPASGPRPIVPMAPSPPARAARAPERPSVRTGVEPTESEARPRTIEERADDEEPRPLPIAPWVSLLQKVLSARAARREPRRVLGGGLGGCLRSVVLVGLILVVLLGIGVFFAGRAFLQALPAN